MSSAVVSVASASLVAPALAAGPIGDGGDQDDPFLVALAAWRRAYADWLAALAAAGKVTDRLEADGRAEETCDHVRIEFGTRQFESDDGAPRLAPRYLFSHDEIDSLAIGTEKRCELHAAFDAKAAWLESAQQTNGLRAARETEQHLIRRERELLCAACYVVPTTPAGVLAFVRFIDDEVLFDEKSQPGGPDGERAVRQCIVTLEQALVRLFGGAAPDGRSLVDRGSFDSEWIGPA
jgi:hypothetical protein